MLLTDRDCITIDDVIAIDSEVADIAATENIPTEGDGSFIHAAVEQIGNTVLSLCQNYSYPYLSSTASASMPNGMWNAGYDSTPGSRIRLGQVVTDSPNTLFASPLKKWITYTALRNLFNIASNRQINDRYDAKKRQYQSEIDNVYWPAFKAAGIPVVWTPIPCPGALYEVGQGTFTSANVSSVVAGGASGGTFDVAITWYSPSLSVESAPSITQSVTVASGHALQVSIASLVVPNFIRIANTLASTGANVTEWYIYAAPTGQPLRYQGSVPVATQTFALASDPTITGALVGLGQQKDVDLTIINALYRC